MRDAQQPASATGVQDKIGETAGRILIVEDDPDNLTICRLILEHGGFEVVEARDGEEGLRRARADLPDLIILDISIPIIDGWEVTKRLREEETTRAIPILVVSAHAGHAEQARAEELGCAGFLVKPIAPSLILERVALQLGGNYPSVSHPRPTA